jgi:hypothetical protein
VEHSGRDGVAPQASGLICYSWRLSPPRRLGDHDSIEHFKKIVKFPLKIVVRSVVFTSRGAVKSNSSGIEVWTGSLVLVGS